MHELALCQGVVNTLAEQARIHHFDRVTAVRLEIGALSCVSPEAIEFCFARRTLADGAGLELVTLPSQAWCLDCDGTVAIGERHEGCPRCGGYRLRLTQGNKDLEVV